MGAYTPDEWLWSRPKWDDRFYDDIITVIGHTPTRAYGREYAGRILKTDTWINVDTSPDPCLLRLDDLKEFYLQ